MANTTPEVPKITPANAPTVTSDTHLKNYRATLVTRLNALNTINGNNNVQFPEIRASVEKALAILQGMQDDAQLHQNPDILRQLDTAVALITNYAKNLRTEERDKKHTQVLNQIGQDIMNMKGEIEKDHPQVASSNPPTSPGVTSATNTGIVGSALRDTLNDVKGAAEGVQKKGFMISIAEALGYDKDNITDKIREIIAKIKTAKGFEGMMEKMFARFKLRLLLPLAKKMGVNVNNSLTPEELNIANGKPSQSVPANSNETTQEDIKTTALYSASYKGMILMNTPGLTIKKTGGTEASVNRTDLGSIFQTRALYDLKHSTGEQLYKKYKDTSDKSGLKKEIGLENTTHDPEYILLALQIIYAPKYLSKEIQEHITKNGDTTIGKLITDLHEEFSLMAHFDSMEIDTSSPVSSMTSLFQSFSGRFHFGSKDGKIEFADSVIQQQAEKAGLNNPEVLVYALSEKNNIDSLTDANINAARLGGESKESLKKLRDFWKNMRSVIIDKFSFDQSAEYSAYISNNPPSLSAVIKLYLATGGNTNYSEMNGARKMGVYALIWSDIFREGSAERGRLVDQVWLKNLGAWVTNAPSAIPPDVQRIASTAVSLAAEKVAGTVSSGVTEIFHSISLEQRIKAGAMISVALYLLWQTRIARATGSGVMVGLTSAALIAAVFPIIQKGLESRKGSDGTYTLADGSKITDDGIKARLENFGNQT